MTYKYIISFDLAIRDIVDAIIRMFLYCFLGWFEDQDSSQPICVEEVVV